MAKCVICNNFFPPGWTEPVDTNAVKCLFCLRQVNVITLQGKDYSKKDVIKEYKTYIKQMAESPDIKNMIIDEKVKKIKEMG